MIHPIKISVSVCVMFILFATDPHLFRVTHTNASKNDSNLNLTFKKARTILWGGGNAINFFLFFLPQVSCQVEQKMKKNNSIGVVNFNVVRNLDIFTSCAKSFGGFEV